MKSQILIDNLTQMNSSRHSLSPEQQGGNLLVRGQGSLAWAQNGIEDNVLMILSLLAITGFS